MSQFHVASLTLAGHELIPDPGGPGAVPLPAPPPRRWWHRLPGLRGRRELLELRHELREGLRKLLEGAAVAAVRWGVELEQDLAAEAAELEELAGLDGFDDVRPPGLAVRDRDGVRPVGRDGGTWANRAGYRVCVPCASGYRLSQWGYLERCPNCRGPLRDGRPRR